MHDEVTATFARDTVDRGICVVDGFGVRIFVRRGHLVVSDGIGAHCRERRFARATARLKRVVVLGHSGDVTLEAFRWMADVGIGFLHMDADGRVLTTSGVVGNDDPRLRRAQALARETNVGLEIARDILGDKLTGQRDVLTSIGRDDVRAEVEKFLQAIQEAASTEEMLAAEAAAALAYWGAWGRIPIPFIRPDQTRVPEHWLTFGQRRSPLSASARLAPNPANAILNYLYGVLEAESRIACLIVGLDPGLGLFHADQRSRDSLALDVMEVARPLVDAYVLELLRSRPFRARDFEESRRGVCRVLPPLTHGLSETATAWSLPVGRAAERVARTLSRTLGSAVEVPTRVSQDNRSRGRDRVRRRPERIVPQSAKRKRPRAACHGCGVVLPTGDRSYCRSCLLDRRRELAEPRRKKALQALAWARESGGDPAHGGEAAKKRGARISTHQAEIARWRDSGGRAHDSQTFRREILPGLQEVSARRMATETGLSEGYCRLIRQGRRSPHARHWEALRRLTAAPG